MRKKLWLLFFEILLILEMRKGIMNVMGNNWKKIIIFVFYKILGFFYDWIELFIIYSLIFFIFVKRKWIFIFEFFYVCVCYCYFDE